MPPIARAVPDRAEVEEVLEVHACEEDEKVHQISQQTMAAADEQAATDRMNG